MTRPATSHPTTHLALVASLLGCAGAQSGAGAQEVARCEPAQRLLTEQLGMVTETEPETVDDWRTGRLVPGCRVTAAGSTSFAMRDQAEGVFYGIIAAGWERTTDPRDAPNESSLRFRMGDTDCLFSFYSGIVIGTESERRTIHALVIPPGESRYNVLVQCIPAMEARPRSP